MSKDLKAALHVHSFYSDGIYLPSFIVGFARLVGVKILSITDHNEIKGTLAGMRVAKRFNFIYYPGIELTFTVNGRAYELLAYFYNEPDIIDFFESYRFNNGFMPNFQSVAQVVNLVRHFRGVVIAPHPFGRKGIFRRGRNKDIKVDGIEIINAFTGDRRNIKAQNHDIDEKKCLKLGTSDMHFFISDISKTYTKIKGEKITKKEIWDNLLGKKKSLEFIPIGRKVPTHKITLQKFLCFFSYLLSYPGHYAGYLKGKRRQRY